MNPRIGSVAVGLTLGLLACSGEGRDTRAASSVEPPRTADLSYAPAVPDPAYPEGRGPAVCVDETHNNFHTSLGTYLPFANVLRRDGYNVHRLTESEGPTLETCAILVIADAQPPDRAEGPPTLPPEEVAELNAWVESGGSLFLITDHMPDPGAVAGLAASFGLEVHDGYVFDGSPEGPARPTVFRRDDGSLTDDPLLDGRTPEEAVTQVATFLGSAFRGPNDFRSLMVFGPGFHSWTPERYYEFREDSPRIDVEGWSQGGVLEFGQGRLALFGEAAMFTAQVFDEGRTRVGMNAPEATHNLRLLLNVMHWLGRLGELPER